VLLLLASVQPARLDFSAEGLADRCPPAEALTAAVRARLHSEPFDDSAPRVVRVTLSRSGSRFSADISLEEPGQPPATRHLTSRSCAELLHSAALVIALALDPLALPEPSQQPPPEPEPEPEPKVMQVPPAPPPGSTVRLNVWAGPDVGVGAAPSVAFGGRLGLALRWRETWSLGLEGRFAQALPVASAFGAYSALNAAGAVLACGSWRVLDVCAEGAGGAFVVRGDTVQGGASTVPTASVGARLGVRLPLTDALAARIEAVGAVPLLHVSVGAASTVVWNAPPVSGALVLALFWAP
jgi:hypothetical protein